MTKENRENYGGIYIKILLVILFIVSIFAMPIKETCICNNGVCEIKTFPIYKTPRIVSLETETLVVKDNHNHRSLFKYSLVPIFESQYFSNKIAYKDLEKINQERNVKINKYSIESIWILFVLVILIIFI